MGGEEMNLKNIYLILLYFVFLSYVFPQDVSTKFSTDSTNKSAVSEFFSEVNAIIERASNSKNTLNIYSDEQLEKLARKYYFVKANDPIGFDNYIMRETQKIRSQFPKSDGDLKVRRPAVKLGIIKRALAERFGEAFSEVIDVPYFIKGKVVKKKYEQFISKIENTSFPQTILTIKIEDIVKGEKIFSEKDFIQLSYLDHWIENSRDTFIIGDSYFFPIKPWNCYNGECTDFALQILSDANFGNYPIKEGIIFIRDNFFGIGENSPWDEFKVKFSNLFLYK